MQGREIGESPVNLNATKKEQGVLYNHPSQEVLGKIMASQRCPCPKTQDLWICYLTWKREIFKCDSVKALELGRLPWIFWVDPMYSNSGRVIKLKTGKLSKSLHINMARSTAPELWQPDLQLQRGDEKIPFLKYWLAWEKRTTDSNNLYFQWKSNVTKSILLYGEASRLQVPVT